jgi:Na+/proline symporter
MTPFEITMVVSIAVMGFYAIYGFVNFRKSSSFDDFFLNDRKLSKANVRNTFTGASISIATVLIFFLTIGINFGWVVLWSPLTLAIGILTFNFVIYPRLLSNSDIIAGLKGESDTPIRSLSDYLNHTYKSRVVTVVTTGVSACGILSILIAEMMVGVVIYQEYFIRPEWIVLLLGITLFLYAGFGGMRSVVETDMWQVYLICLSIFLIICFIIWRTIALDGGGQTGFDIEDLLFDWKAQAKMPLSLWMNILIVNLCLLPSSLRVWQVIAASSKQKGFQRGLLESTGFIVLIVLGTLIISKGVIGLTGTANQSIGSIFLFLTNAGGVAAYIIYPLFVAAMLSALVSTADSAILPLSQGTVTLLGKEDSFSAKLNTLNILWWIAVTIILFWVVSYVLKMDLVGWILTVFAITTCIAPVVVAPLFFTKRTISQVGGIIVAAGVVLALFAAIAWSVVHKDSVVLIPWNCVIGFTISTITTAIGFLWFAPPDKTIVRSTSRDA